MNLSEQERKIMSRKIFKVYADTSVFGGVFDTEFDTVSLRFFQHIRNKDFHSPAEVIYYDEQDI